jgi:hypothetical protein
MYNKNKNKKKTDLEKILGYLFSCDIDDSSFDVHTILIKESLYMVENKTKERAIIIEKDSKKSSKQIITTIERGIVYE